MKWKEALFIKNKEKKIDYELYDALLKLPEIREHIFMPDYKKNGYVVLEPNYFEFDVGFEQASGLNMFLTSKYADRLIGLSYIFSKTNELGIFNDTIRVLSAKNGWGVSINLSLLAKKKNLKLIESYEDPKIYTGSPEQKLEACLRQIKQNYDTIAPDIISGEVWDSNAWNIGGHF